MKVSRKVLDLARHVQKQGRPLNDFAKEMGVSYSQLIRKLKGKKYSRKMGGWYDAKKNQI